MTGLLKPKPVKKPFPPRRPIGKAKATKDLEARLEEERKKRKKKKAK